MAAKFEIDKSSDDQFIFRLVSEDGEKILKGERYTAKHNCKKGIKSVQDRAEDDDNYDKKKDEAGKFRFNIVARENDEVVGTSVKGYDTESERDDVIKQVKRDAPKAEIKDLT
ncbi:YegP family protein [Alteromonas sp. a30]|uniref:YegP family protein n=1 Tax=Alteromonas sp. a30 TaxID=2730917 RepID=UPI0022810804|nr:YegP family protein [Alteromonas sp. a30]MCY7293810.1 YegP family protein [Alteromonas sp. a30]